MSQQHQRKTVSILFLCASSKTVAMNPPKLVKIVDHFFPKNPRNYYFVGDSIQNNSKQCRTDLTKQNWISICEFSSVLFDMIIVEFCPICGISVLGPPFFALQALLAPNGIFSITVPKGKYGIGNIVKYPDDYIEFEPWDIINYLPDLSFIDIIKVNGSCFQNFQKN